MKPRVLMITGIFTTALLLGALAYPVRITHFFVKALSCSEACTPLFWYSVLALAVLTWVLMVMYLIKVRKAKNTSMRDGLWGYVALLIVFIGCVYAFIFGYLFILTLVY